MKETRLTLQKQIIYQAVCQLKNHPTAEDVYTQVHLNYPNISKATVYRVLKQLAEQDKLLKLDFDEQVRYDDLCTKHFHFKCTRCGKIVDIPATDEMLHSIEILKKGLSSTLYIDNSDLILKGICNDCQKETKK